MTTHTTAPTIHPRSWRATRLGRAAAAVALSTLAVVMLASGAFAALSDTIDLLGFQAESDDSSGVVTNSVDLAVGEGTCAVAFLDPAASIVTIAPNTTVIPVGWIADGGAGPAPTPITELCIKSESTVPVDWSSAVISATSFELNDCIAAGVEEAAELAVGGSCLAGDAGELDSVVSIELLCTNGNAYIPLHSEGPGIAHHAGQLQPGEMIDCSVIVSIDSWTNPIEDFQRALTDSLQFDLAITGEQI